ncbi:scavenger receptor cysteine-rich type 1 protein M130-like [Mustelus asterias]
MEQFVSRKIHKLIQKLRLVSGISECVGRLEIRYLGQWGTVEDSPWDLADAAVVCRELGCGTALSAPRGAYFGEGSGYIVTYNVQCRGNENALRKCQSGGWSRYDLSHSYDASVICSGIYFSAFSMFYFPDDEGTNLELSVTRNGMIVIVQFVSAYSCCIHIRMNKPLCKQYVNICPLPLITSSSEVFPKATAAELDCGECHNHSLNFHSRSQQPLPGIDQPKVLGCIGRSTLPRLLNGSHPCAGRLEIYWNGNWGTVCKDEAWSSPEAEAVCQLLDCGSVTAMPLISHFGPGSGPVIGREGCGHQQDFAVICSDESWSLRLTNGGSSCDGRVEIYHNSSWGRVQDSFWDLNDANVVCRQLECGDARSVYNSSKYGESDEPVLLNDVHCEGNESHLRSCRSFLLDSSLNDRFGVGVLCSGHEQLRLSDGEDRCAGRVEIYYNGTWGSVCDDSWDLTDAHVVCKQLSCGTALDAALPASSGPSVDSVWLDEVNCSGDELFLWDCPSASWGNHDCNQKEDVNIMCSEYKELRLVNGKHRCEGRVEVFYNGTWGAVCSDKLDNHDAEVICKQLHCGAFSYINYDAQLFGPGTGPIWLDNIECNLNERTLWQCQTDTWGKHNCQHSEDAGVVCSESIVGKEEVDRPPECVRKSDLGLPVRLVGGDNNCSGRVEILCNHLWGTVCDDPWDIEDANVVCRQSGCGSALFAPGGAYFTQGEGDIWLEEVKCTGMEYFLSDCPTSSSAQSDCNHKEDASVICSGPEAALTDSPSSTAAQGIEKTPIPVVICITLGVLLICELSALMAVIQRTLKRKDAVTGASGPPAGSYQGIYEEIESIPSGKIFDETCGSDPVLGDYDDAETEAYGTRKIERQPPKISEFAGQKVSLQSASCTGDDVHGKCQRLITTDKTELQDAF